MNFIDTKFDLIIPKKLEDHKWLCELHNDPLVLRNITNPNAITIDEHMNWWYSLNWNCEQRYIFTVNDVNVGFTKFYKIDYLNESCALGADIHDNFRGQGFAKPMWRLMLKKCFEEFKLHRVCLTTASFNQRAIKIYNDLGFKEEGRHIQSLKRDHIFYDEICMFMLKETWHDSQ